MRSLRERSEYSEWLKTWDVLNDKDRKAIKADLPNLHGPLISIVLPVYNPPAEFLSQAIESVIRQLYPKWELCIVDDASTEPHVKPLLERYAKQDSRIKVRTRPQTDTSLRPLTTR